MAKHSTWNPKGLAGAFGIFWGVYLFVLALLTQAGLNFAGFSREMFEMIRAVYMAPAYTATLMGAVVGLVIGLLCGGIGGYLIALLYNWCSAKF